MKRRPPGAIESSHCIWALSTMDIRYHALRSSDIEDLQATSYTALCQHTNKSCNWTNRNAYVQTPLCDDCLLLANRTIWPAQQEAGRSMDGVNKPGSQDPDRGSSARTASGLRFVPRQAMFGLHSDPWDWLCQRRQQALDDHSSVDSGNSGSH
ncbi:hypothetical protein GCM10010452_02730 [Crossiella cryophila]